VLVFQQTHKKLTSRWVFEATFWPEEIIKVIDDLHVFALIEDTDGTVAVSRVSGIDATLSQFEESEILPVLVPNTCVLKPTTKGHAFSVVISILNAFNG
jgi:hypothetical protein